MPCLFSQATSMPRGLHVPEERFLVLLLPSGFGHAMSDLRRRRMGTSRYSATLHTVSAVGPHVDFLAPALCPARVCGRSAISYHIPLSSMFLVSRTKTRLCPPARNRPIPLHANHYTGKAMRSTSPAHCPSPHAHQPVTSPPLLSRSHCRRRLGRHGTQATNATDLDTAHGALCPSPQTARCSTRVASRQCLEASWRGVCLDPGLNGTSVATSLTLAIACADERACVLVGILKTSEPSMPMYPFFLVK